MKDSTGTLIIYYNVANADTYKNILLFARQAGHSIKYDLPMMHAVIVVNINISVEVVTANNYQSIPGVLLVQVSQDNELSAIIPP